MEAVGHAWKECWQLMLRKRGRALCRQPRPGKSLVKQTQLSTLWSLNSPWANTVDFWSMRRKEKCKKAGSGRPSGRNKGGSALLLSVSKDTWRVIQPGTGLKAWTSLRRLLHVYSLQGGRTFFLSKEKQSSHGNFSPQQRQQPWAQCSMHSQKMCPTKSWESPHQMSLRVFQLKTFGYGWSRGCVEMVWRQTIWQARDLQQNLFSRKSENLYKEWIDTPSRNLAEQSIEVHFLFSADASKPPKVEFHSL